MQGSGKVRDLWEAASLSSALQAQLTTYSAATTRAAQPSQIDVLLLDWADTAGMLTLEQRLAENDRFLVYRRIGVETCMESLAA